MLHVRSLSDILLTSLVSGILLLNICLVLPLMTSTVNGLDSSVINGMRIVFRRATDGLCLRQVSKYCRIGRNFLAIRRAKRWVRTCVFSLMIISADCFP